MRHTLKYGIRGGRIVIASIVGVLTGVEAGTTRGAITNWQNAAGGTWSTTGNWSGGVPAAGKEAIFNLNAPAAYGVTLTTGGSADAFRVQNDRVSLNLSGRTLSLGTTLTVGESASHNGQLSLSNGRLNSVTGIIGWSAGTVGSLTIGIGQTWVNSGSVYVGGSTSSAGGTGTININAGTMSVSGTLKVWNSGTSAINLAGGTLTVATLDLSSSYSRLAWSGGELQFAAAQKIEAGGALGGLVTLDGARKLTMLNNYAEHVGSTGAGTFVQTGGTHATQNTLDIGHSSTSTGTYSLGGSGILTASWEENIGYFGIGNFVQNGGTHTISNGFGAVLNLGRWGGSVGNYTLSGDGLLSVGTSETLGYAGAGNFVQTGGTHTVSSTLHIGAAGSGTGNYTLTGAALLATNRTEVGESGVANFLQAGGTHQSGSLHVGGSGGACAYTLSNDGILSVTDEGVSGASSSVTGLFVQTSGTNTVTSSTSAGNGTIWLSGGLHTTGGLYLGSDLSESAGMGVYSLSGTGRLSVAQATSVNGGTFIQSGGTHSVGTDLSIGKRVGGAGRYSLSAGVLAVSGSETVGALGGGPGTFVQSGGIHTVGNSLSVWSLGNYTMSAGTLSAPYILVSGTSSMNLAGGTITVSEGFENSGARGLRTAERWTARVAQARSSHRVRGWWTLGTPA